MALEPVDNNFCWPSLPPPPDWFAPALAERIATASDEATRLNAERASIRAGLIEVEAGEVTDAAAFVKKCSALANKRLLVAAADIKLLRLRSEIEPEAAAACIARATQYGGQAAARQEQLRETLAGLGVLANHENLSAACSNDEPYSALHREATHARLFAMGYRVDPLQTLHCTKAREALLTFAKGGC